MGWLHSSQSRWGALTSTSIPSSCSFYTASSLLRINFATRARHAVTRNPQRHLDQLLPCLLEATGRCSEVEEEEAAAAGRASTAAGFAERPLHRSCSCHARSKAATRKSEGMGQDMAAAGGATPGQPRAAGAGSYMENRASPQHRVFARGHRQESSWWSSRQNC